MARLVDAYAHCRGPEDAGEAPLDLVGFKRLVRDLDLWCSSSMLATEGEQPIAVLFGAKRDAATLVHTLRVHPDYRRRGHARHLLTSLSQKLAILGPSRLVAEVAAERGAARALFAACGWRSEARLVDWRRPPTAEPLAAPAPGVEPPITPIAPAEAVASGLFPGAARTWGRAPEAIDRPTAPPDALAFYSLERLEACVVYHLDAGGGVVELLALGATGSELGRAALRLLLGEVERRGGGAAELRLLGVADDELAPGLLSELGFAPAGERLLFAAEARAA